MRVAVYLADQNPHRDRSLGITSMTRSLLDELSKREDLQLTLVSSKSSFGADGRTETARRLPFRTDHAIGRIISDLFHPILARPVSDLWYYPKGYLSLFSRPSVPLVGTMHDAILQHYADYYPETRTPHAFQYWIGVMKNSLRRFDSVMTVSQHAKIQLEKFCDRHRIQTPSIRVTYESSSWEFHRKRRWPKRDEVVHLASSAPHKKTNHLLSMWLQLQREGRELPRLRLVGSLDDYGKRKMSELKFVSITPPLDDESLVEAVGSARALLLPSEIEGFGLPALEAYYVGTPVCYVAGTSVGEVVSEAGGFGAFELADTTSLFQAIDFALGQSSKQIESISDLLFSKFSNQIYADRVIQTFSSVLGR
ncbi:MAG: glycosyltransferase [Planctomycetota bacterium]|nr:glycosyltransferase [Planctomycetota bacterium]